MGTGQLTTVLRQLRRLATTSEVGRLSDGELLERFVRTRDEAAFELLVWRHGTMVLNLCRRLLGQPHDADDAFQATFLALVRKARAISKREALASWLHKVAYRVALRARERAVKRNLRECDGVHLLPAPSSVAQLGGEWGDLKPVLDEEVGRLPAHYRVPVILCYLEGKTNAEAAELLGCPRGTIAVRLSRARDLLRSRLTRRGVTLSAGALGLLLAEHAAEAAVPSLLIESTIQAGLGYAAGKTLTAGAISANVIALTEGVLHAMFLTKLKLAAGVVLTVGVLGMATGLLTYQATAQPGEGAGAALAQKAQPGEKPGRKTGLEQDLQKLRADLEQIEAVLAATQAKRETVRSEIERVVQAMEKGAPKPANRLDDLQRRIEDLTKQLQAERDRAAKSEMQAREAEAAARLALEQERARATDREAARKAIDQEAARAAKQQDQVRAAEQRAREQAEMMRAALEQERAAALAERDAARRAMEQTRLLQEKFEAIFKEAQDIQKQAPNVKMDRLLKELQDAIQALPKENKPSQPPPKKKAAEGNELSLRQRLLQRIWDARLRYEMGVQAKGNTAHVQSQLIAAVQDGLKELVALNEKPNKTAEERAALQALAQHLGKIQGARSKWETAFQIVNDDQRAGPSVSANDKLIHRFQSDQAWSEFAEAVEAALKEPTQAAAPSSPLITEDKIEALRRKYEAALQIVKDDEAAGDKVSANDKLIHQFECQQAKYDWRTAVMQRDIEAAERRAHELEQSRAAQSSDLILTIEASTDPQKQGKLGQLILKDGATEHKFTEPGKLTELLQELKKVQPERESITIRADGQLGYVHVVAVTRLCRDAGFGRLSLEQGGARVAHQPPPGDLRGQIKAVDKDGLVSVSIGSDAGLQKGHTLEVYRAAPKPLYLGVIEIIEVTPQEAVGRPATPRFKDQMQTGDQVASRILPAKP